MLVVLGTRTGIVRARYAGPKQGVRKPTLRFGIWDTLTLMLDVTVSSSLACDILKTIQSCNESSGNSKAGYWCSL